MFIRIGGAELLIVSLLCLLVLGPFLAGLLIRIFRGTPPRRG